VILSKRLEDKTFCLVAHERSPSLLRIHRGIRKLVWRCFITVLIIFRDSYPNCISLLSWGSRTSGAEGIVERRTITVVIYLSAVIPNQILVYSEIHVLLHSNSLNSSTGA